jgi:hypothetical protein
MIHAAAVLALANRIHPGEVMNITQKGNRKHTLSSE